MTREDDKISESLQLLYTFISYVIYLR